MQHAARVTELSLGCDYIGPKKALSKRMASFTYRSHHQSHPLQGLENIYFLGHYPCNTALVAFPTVSQLQVGNKIILIAKFIILA